MTFDELEILFMQGDQAKEQLDTQFKLNEITLENYNKGITTIAYEYAINGYPDDCLEMLTNVSKDYFKSIANDHCREDEVFFNKCALIFEILQYDGKISHDIMATQKLANA